MTSQPPQPASTSAPAVLKQPSWKLQSCGGKVSSMLPRVDAVTHSTRPKQAHVPQDPPQLVRQATRNLIPQGSRSGLAVAFVECTFLRVKAGTLPHIWNQVHQRIKYLAKTSFLCGKVVPLMHWCRLPCAQALHQARTNVLTRGLGGKQTGNTCLFR